MIVIGPSFVSDTCMSAPKTPVADVGAPLAQPIDDGVHEGLGHRAGSRRVPRRAAALAGVAVERELADDKHGQAQVRGRQLAGDDVERPAAPRAQASKIRRS